MTVQERVLAWVNRQRAQVLGLKPIDRLPKSKTGECNECVIAKGLTHRSRCFVSTGFYRSDVTRNDDALDVSADGTYCIRTNHPDATRIEHPHYVAKFIERFDDGAYPELVA